MASPFVSSGFLSIFVSSWAKDNKKKPVQVVQIFSSQVPKLQLLTFTAQTCHIEKKSWNGGNSVSWKHKSWSWQAQQHFFASLSSSYSIFPKFFHSVERWFRCRLILSAICSFSFLSFARLMTSCFVFFLLDPSDIQATSFTQLLEAQITCNRNNRRYTFRVLLLLRSKSNTEKWISSTLSSTNCLKSSIHIQRVCLTDLLVEMANLNMKMIWMLVYLVLSSSS